MQSMIGPATLRDFWTLRRKPRNLVLLYNEAMLAKPHRWFWYAARCLVEGGGKEGTTLLYRERGMRALAQSVGRHGRPEQDIVTLAAYGGGHGHPTDRDVWFRLLEALCVRAGQYRVQRLYAALSQRHEELREMFRQLGFVNYGNQIVLRLEGPDWDQGTTLAAMRPQMRHDDLAIHKLYGSITPRMVQEAEARNPLAWRISRTARRRPRVRGWVMGQEDDLVAYLRITSGPATHIMTLLIRPEDREYTADIVRFGLGQVHDAQSVLLVLRDYQQELLLPASDLGFQPIGEQALLCKHTTVTARRTMLVPALEPSLEPRVPIPTISFGEDARRYVRTTRDN